MEVVEIKTKIEYMFEISLEYYKLRFLYKRIKFIHNSVLGVQLVNGRHQQVLYDHILHKMHITHLILDDIKWLV